MDPGFASQTRYSKAFVNIVFECGLGDLESNPSSERVHLAKERYHSL